MPFVGTEKIDPQISPLIRRASGDGFPPSFSDGNYKVSDAEHETAATGVNSAVAQQIFGVNAGTIQWSEGYSPGGTTTYAPADEWYSPQGAGSPNIQVRLLGMIQGVFTGTLSDGAWRTIFQNGGNSDMRVSQTAVGETIAHGVFELRDVATMTTRARWRFKATARK